MGVYINQELVVDPLSRADIEKTAMEFLDNEELRQSQVGLKVDLEKVLDLVCEQYEFATEMVSDEEWALLYPNYLAYTDFDLKIMFFKTSTYLDMAISGRDRFTIAHEIGHVILHSHQKEVLSLKAARTDQNKTIAVEHYKKSEWQANAFAAALIMPENDCKSVIYHDLANGYREEDIIKSIKTTFEVSKEAAKIRYEKLIKEMVPVARTTRTFK